MSVLKTITLSIIVLLLEQLVVCESRFCSWSKNSALSVDSCPESKNEFERKEKLKNCTSLAVIQNCTKPVKFKYHCLIDEAEKTFIEVCVPLYIITLGFCAEYNTVGALVQQHRGLKCSDMEPPCPQLYNSTDAYLYKGCYDIVKSRRQTTSSDINFELSTKLTTKENYFNSSLENFDTVKPLNAGMVIFITFAVVVFLLIAIVTMSMVVRYRKHQRKLGLMTGDKDNSASNDSSYWFPDEDIPMLPEGEESGIHTRESADLPSRSNDIHGVTQWPRSYTGGHGAKRCFFLNFPIHIHGVTPCARCDTDRFPPCFLHGGCRDTRELYCSSSEESEEEEEDSNTVYEKRKECNIEEYKEELKKAKLLRDTVAVKDTEIAANFDRKKADANNFLQAYKDVLECFVKTGMLKKCQTSLKKYGITILSGQQGSGKTLSAVYIMSKNKRYNNWTKLKFTSWVDLLTIKLETKTLVYIDNLFDGHLYMYPEELRKWWRSLIYFYFERIQSSEDIHLLITVKDDVLKEACEHIKINIDENTFCLKAELLPLLDKEKKKILKSQFKLAKTLKGIPISDIDSTYEEIKKIEKYCAIGFPLCAHLYAFEPVFKSKSIFTDPKSYVINHFEREIGKDSGTGVKTLFLFLLFYTSLSSLKKRKRLDLRYGKDIREFLEDPEVVSENFVKEMEPLDFENLPKIAESLKYTILVKHSEMFEFKHQIYLDGASEYFFRKNSEVAVRNFPLYIIRSYAFPDASMIDWNNLAERFMRELQDNITFHDTQRELESCRNMIPEVLSCEIFDKEQFETKFKSELEKDGALYYLLLNKKLCFPFWASRFRRKILSATTFNFVEHSDYQFYQCLFGECCGKDRKYYSGSSADLDLVTLKEKVWKFKTADGKSILHIIISSQRSDYEAHLLLEKMLKDTWEQDVLLINDLLKCASEYQICSRILCMLELLRKQNEFKTGHKPPDVSNVIAQLKSIKDYNAHFELEFLVRICIVLAVCEAPIKKVNTDYNSIDERFLMVRKLLGENEHTESRMTETIKECLAKCRTSVSPSLEAKGIPFTDRIGSKLKQAICDSVGVLSRKNVLAEKVDVN